MLQSHVEGRRKQSRGKGGTWMRKGTGRVRGEHDQVLGWVEQDWSSEGQQKEWKQGTSRGRRWGDPQNVPETWDVRDSQDSKRGTLDEMPYSGERKLVEPTSSRDRASSEGKVAIPRSKTLNPNCSCLKELQGWRPRKRRYSSKWDPAQGEAPRPDTYYGSCGALTKRDLKWLPSERLNKQLKESGAGICIQPMDRSSWPQLLN
jgi:hypothetical protein